MNNLKLVFLDAFKYRKPPKELWPEFQRRGFGFVNGFGRFGSGEQMWFWSDLSRFGLKELEALYMEINPEYKIDKDIV